MSPLLKRVEVVSKAVIAICLLAIVTFEYVRPFLVDVYFREQYRALVVQCDQAMHDEVALRAGTAGAKKEPTLTLAADVDLAICHQYDKLRKRLLAFGISEEQLALHGVQALEHEQIPVSRMVDPHRMDRF